jgi:hypothetical protein
MGKGILISACCAMILLGGCGQSAEERAVEKQIEKETGSDAHVDVSEKGMTISGKTEEGEFTVSSGDEAKIPDDFPADVFIYRPSQAKMAVKLPEGYSVAFTTSADQSAVVGAYEKEMTAKGWTEESSMQMGGNSVMVYAKGDRSASVTIAAAEDELTIHLTVTKN